MSSYFERLQSIYSPVIFERKLAYLQHNIGGFLPKTHLKEACFLEIGPGMGEFISLANDLGVHKIDIVDNDKDVLEYIHKTYKIRKKFLTTNIQSIDKSLSTYTAIVLVQVFEHIPPEQYTSLLQTLYKHLKVNGHIYIVVPSGNNPLGSVERYSDSQHYNLFTTQSLRDLGFHAGLKNAKVTVRGFEIPPNSGINIIRIVLQKILHAFILGIMMINGGVYFTILTPNIILDISKEN